MRKKEYWQSIRGICILAVVLIHALGGFDYHAHYALEFIVLRQIINFAVAIFIFMAGYFVPVAKIDDKAFSYKEWLLNRGGGRLCIPFVLWSLFYSGISIIKDIYHGESIHWMRYAYRFVIGKSAVPFYYIVVLLQLTVITPWIVKVVKKGGVVKNLLWFVTPVYLVYVYVWNFTTGSSPRLYETLFPAWFGFYYLGIQVKCGLRLRGNGLAAVIAFVISCMEAFGLRRLGMDIGFCTSQITFGSFLFSITVIGYLLKQSTVDEKCIEWLVKIGDCSYGIFYTHMFVLMAVERFVTSENWYIYWISRFAVASVVSAMVVMTVQRILKRQKSILRHIGFI